MRKRSSRAVWPGTFRASPDRIGASRNRRSGLPSKLGVSSASTSGLSVSKHEKV
jgi:hypothetical protein